MAEYIDKETLVNEIEKNKIMAREQAARRILEIIKNMTVFVGVGLNGDVAPVVHARWVNGECSNCGVDIPTDDAHDAIFESECHFCYYCGAKMDGAP